MYAPVPNYDLPIHKKIGSNWLSLAYEGEFFGYRNGEYGGNFVHFSGNTVKFSYHKDFVLKSSADYFLTNLDIAGDELASDIIEYDFYSNDRKTYSYQNSTITEYKIILSNIEKILFENICNLDNLKIVYSAGLDSSTVAYMAEHYKLNFTVLVADRFKFTDLPFRNIKQCYLGMPEFNIDYGSKYVRDSFYRADDNNAVTGFYGDLTVTHNTDMYYQAKHLLSSPASIIPYHKKEPNNYIKFNSREDIISAIKYVNTHTYFRHWFDNFNIIDPYRDPRLFEEIIKLPTDILIEQIATGRIQKDIIQSYNSEWLNNLCPSKNDYTKFY